MKDTTVVIGIDLGGTKISAALFKLDGSSCFCGYNGTGAGPHAHADPSESRESFNERRRDSERAECGIEGLPGVS